MIRYCTIALCFLISSHANAAFRFVLDTVPWNTPLADTVFIEVIDGDFSALMAMNQTAPRHWELNVNRTFKNDFSVKFYLNKNLQGRNHKGVRAHYFVPNQPKEFHGSIHSWSDEMPRTTASKNVYILEDDFYSPELNNRRRIWVYLPASYSSNNNSYPTIYFQDGQNLFDAYTSFVGEWGIDEYLDSTLCTQNTIIIGIDNMGEHRTSEYSAWPHEKYAPDAKGKEYATFITRTLVPFVDYTLNTSRLNTDRFIAGSSLGSNISHFIATRYPHHFSKAALISPAIWFTLDSGINYTDITQVFIDNGFDRDYQLSQDYLITAGDQESRELIADCSNLFMHIHRQDLSKKVELNVFHNAEHNELSWRQQLPIFFAFFNCQPDSVVSDPFVVSFYGEHFMQVEMLNREKIEWIELLDSPSGSAQHRFLCKGEVIYRDLFPRSFANGHSECWFRIKTLEGNTYLRPVYIFLEKK